MDITPPTPTAPPPDTQDWTWVLRRRCDQCGTHAGDLAASDVAEAVRATTARWVAVLGRADVARRPDPQVWSPLEYACHVRDVHRVYLERVDLMLTREDPHYANWDQDATAVAERYDLSDPTSVAMELAAAADALAARLDGITGDQWQRTGVRSDGAQFTIDTMVRYYLHDVVHHLVDVGAGIADLVDPGGDIDPVDPMGGASTTQ